MPAAPIPIRKALQTGGKRSTGAVVIRHRIDIRALSRHNAMPTMYQDYIGFRCALSSE